MTIVQAGHTLSHGFIILLCFWFCFLCIFVMIPYHVGVIMAQYLHHITIAIPYEYKLCNIGRPGVSYITLTTICI